MTTVGVSELRGNLLGFLQKVKDGEILTITSRGHEVAMLVPLENKMKKSREMLQQLRKKAVIADVLSPVGEEWESMQ